MAYSLLYTIILLLICHEYIQDWSVPARSLELGDILIVKEQNTWRWSWFNPIQDGCSGPYMAGIYISVICSPTEYSENRTITCFENEI